MVDIGSFARAAAPDQLFAVDNVESRERQKMGQP
jgi:hypothetical protein